MSTQRFMGRSQPAWLNDPRNDGALSVILKVVGELCNLDCAYCYEHRRPYQSQRTLTAKTLRKFLSWIGPRPLSVELHGGEPLLLTHVQFEVLVETLADHSAPVRLKLQTNATLIDEAWVNTLLHSTLAIEVGVSFDGPGALNHLRWDYSGRSSEARVRAGVEHLEAAGIPFGMIAVVHQGSLGSTRTMLDFVASTDARILKLAPCFDVGVKQGQGPRRSQATLRLSESTVGDWQSWAISTAEYTTFLTEIWTEWRAAEHFTRFLLEPHGSVVRRLAGRPVQDCHFTAQKCGSVITLYPDGRVGSCDELDRDSGYLGRLEPELASHAQLWGTGRLKTEMKALAPACGECTQAPVCGGGCIATRLRLREAGIDEQYCDHRRAFINFMASEVTDV